MRDRNYRRGDPTGRNRTVSLGSALRFVDPVAGTDFLLRRVAEWRARQAAELAAAGATNSHGLIFTRADGRPLHPHTVSQAFQRADHSLGGGTDPLSRSPPHPRQPSAPRPRPDQGLSERLGHSNPAFTMTTYQHVIPGMQEEPPTHSANFSPLTQTTRAGQPQPDSGNGR